ncbi:MAG: 16S rRNA processing protein RimM [Clostridia bacterium]|nr:16S rRNA processing protein RimM [Clostridia bacterium]
MKNEYLECGRVCGAHGVRGVLKVEPWCDTPKVLASAKRVYLSSLEGEYSERKVLTASVNGATVLMSIEGVLSRDDAIAMRDTVLYMHRDDIPLGRGQMFLADMIGLSVIDADSGKVYGSVKKVEEAPRGLLYTVATESGDVIYPSGAQFIKEIDPERGMLITPIPGFFD